ncbi:unnamed protein product [Cladocopium goreaui]|uniref:Saposin B-type domain-containing protein n=1 Tax=Cladocopium goreaui TaxID=2562237 RepID=A0A9P1GBE3_9DINO|nr:unnamed protein product [Cladocopium goreaui]
MAEHGRTWQSTANINRNSAQLQDTYFTFATRAEARPNASIEFTPDDFINDYRSKFVNATGSSFNLISGGGPKPNRIDESLGVKYYEVEYVVRTQLGFSFDSLKTLHFITTFAASKDAVNIMNCQALDDKWDEDGATLRKVAESFTVCQVCEQAVEEAIIYSKENKISSEDDLNDMIDGLCSVKKKEGRWVAHLDIVQEDAGGPLSVEKQDGLGYCRGECTIVQRACQSSLRGKEESLASMLQQDTANKKMKEKVCKKICEKKRPKIADWKDEPFEPRDPKEVETQDMMAKMKAETGMSMKMYSREELERMTDGDMETMAAREAGHPNLVVGIGWTFFGKF